MTLKRFQPIRFLIALAIGLSISTAPANGLQQSGTSEPEGSDNSARIAVEEALQSLFEVAKTVELKLEDLTAGYEAMMWCPNGEEFRRERRWDSSMLRSLPVRSVEEDLRTQCALPEGLPQSQAAWWLSPARQEYACSGPFGNEMSRWGEDYEFLQEACAIHDICYRSRMEKPSCDALFRDNMLTLCQNPGLGDWLASGFCEVAVEVTTEVFGHEGFRNAYELGQAELSRRVGM